MNVSKLISPDTKILANGTVTGTIHYVSNFTGFSTNLEEQSGYYFPLKLTGSGSKMTLKKNGVATKTDIGYDPEIVFILTDKNTVCSVEVDSKEVISLNFTKATFDPKD